MKVTQPKQKKATGHSARAHAILSASGASRWINCTPSARLEEKFGERQTTSYAQEGTLAHELCELYLKYDVFHALSKEEFNAELDKAMESELFSAEMLDMVPIYVDYIKTELQGLEARSGGLYKVDIEIEQQLDLTEYVPESFGTADCVLAANDVLEVIDFKYGKGVPVYADSNNQLMLYGLGALRKFDILYDIKVVRLTIIQPRIGNISTWDISVEDLLTWATEKLRPAAEAAFKGTGELNAGAWCKFCAVKNKCRELANQQLELAKFEFAKPPMLSDEEIAEILSKVDQLVEWANSVHAYALDQAVNNNKIWPGYKLVEGVSKRKWIDNEETIAETIFANIPEATEDDIYDMKIKGISTLEKTFGKKRIAEALKDVIIKPHGKPTLVPLTDKRAALGIEEAMQDFK